MCLLSLHITNSNYYIIHKTQVDKNNISKKPPKKPQSIIAYFTGVLTEVSWINYC